MADPVITLQQANARVQKKYGLEGEIPRANTIETMLWRLKVPFDDLSRLKGVRLLDIGCGSRSTYEPREKGDSYAFRQFEPWICRWFAECGSEVLGIDLHAQEGERFRWIRRDLSKNGALKDLPSEKFDCVVSCGFLNFFGELDNKRSSPTLLAMTTLGQRRSMEKELLAEISRLLREGGSFISYSYGFNHTFLEKTNGAMAGSSALTLLE